jgi:lipopolysaccharide/colanic/teichoic acid biosynthesis glycosyltransferase
MVASIYFLIKGLIDRLLALILLLIGSPLWFLTILLQIHFSGIQNIFFYQVRPGYKGKTFNLIKLKTMQDELVINSFARILRKTGLDEWPQLWNILMGEMSFIGPRPLLLEYWDKYNARQKKRHDVMPGITGWAQVHGRNETSWNERFEYDIWYLENQSFLLDIRIIALTFKQLFSGNNSKEMPLWNGNN